MGSKKLVIDIKPPEKKRKAKALIFWKSASGPRPKIIAREAARSPRYFVFSAAAIFLGLIAVTAFGTVGFLKTKAAAIKAAPELFGKFQEAGRALSSLETQKAKSSLTEIETEIQSLKSTADRYGVIKISEFWSSAVPQLKTVSESFKNLVTLNASALRFTAGLEQLKNNVFRWLTTQRGYELIQNLERLKDDLAAVARAGAALKDQGESIGYPLAEDFLNFRVNLVKTEKILSAALNWLKNPEEKRLAVFFQNPSELRPAGGFLGSFAELVINQNGIQDIKVWDIYDPDGQLKINFVPPRELQATTPRWGARDANWFFDFPTSAAKVIGFLEKSLIYRERDLVFHGAIALNVNVLGTILAVTGPIALPDYELTLNEENFLSEIQREVETGADKLVGQPKRILKVLTPLLFEKIAALDAGRKKALFQMLGEHLTKKDLMFYFKDWEIENYLMDAGFSGAVMKLPENLSGDYLAVVNANVAGGKSDAVIAQQIKLASKIDQSGRIENYLTIEKSHSGDRREEPWYQKTNKSYLKVFTPLGSRLVYMKGHEPKKIKPKLDYLALDYLIDPDLRAVEETALTLPESGAEQMEEAQKTVFASRFNVQAGATKKLELEYLNPTRLNLEKDVVAYQFIFEKQSGAKTGLDFLIEAPVGWRWRESNSPLFNYESDDPAGRLIINLTLHRDLPANQR